MRMPKTLHYVSVQIAYMLPFPADTHVHGHARTYAHTHLPFTFNIQIKTELGWEPKYTNLRDTLETSWRFFQKYPNGYERKDNSAVGQHVIMS